MRRSPGSLAGRFSRGGALLALAAALAGLTVAGCGSGDDTSGEQAGTYKIDILSATFPGRQRLAENVKLRLVIKNIDSETIPNLAVSIGRNRPNGVVVGGFNQHQNDPTLSDPERPIWILNTPPYSSTTAFSRTWTVGEVAPGQTKVMTWRLTPVQSGTYTVIYQVAAGLNNNTKAVLSDGSAAKGRFLVRISSVPRPVQNPIE